MKLMFHGQPVFDVGPLVKEVTQAEYDALPSEQRSDTLFVITDTEPSAMANVTVTEYDTEDGWHVRKWSNGYVEASGLFTVTISVWDTNSSGLYYGNSWIYVNSPIELVTTYSKSVVMEEGPSVWIRPTIVYGEPVYQCVSDAKRSTPMTYSVHITGRWK